MDASKPKQTKKKKERKRNTKQDGHFKNIRTVKTVRRAVYKIERNQMTKFTPYNQRVCAVIYGQWAGLSGFIITERLNNTSHVQCWYNITSQTYGAAPSKLATLWAITEKQNEKKKGGRERNNKTLICVN